MTKYQEQLADDVSRVRKVVAEGVTKRTVVPLSEGAVEVSDATEHFYGVFPLVGPIIVANGVGVHRDPRTGEPWSADEEHKLEVVVKRAYRVARRARAREAARSL